jgi:formylmethanofuran dehydrogenase subunit C
MSLRLQLRRPPGLRLDLRDLTPTALAPLSVAEVEKFAIAQGNRVVPLAEFFDVAKHAGDEDLLAFEGDLARCDRIGWQLAAGRVLVEGSVGDYAGACMSAGELTVRGNAGLLAACEMAGGSLRVNGNVGDFAASGLPGSMDGMRGGSLVVGGNVGERFGDRMRRGTAVIHGNAGAFLASRMVAGTLALAGSAGAHVGYGMRRGSIVFAGPAPEIPATFVPAIAAAPVFWQLLARDLAQHGGAFTALAQRGMQRHLGDVSAAGKGELILVT